MIGAFVRAAIPLLAVSAAMPVSAASAQSASGLVGAWNLVAITVEQDGKVAEPYGPAPKGIMMIESNGRFSITIVRVGLPKFASNNRTKGTAEEYQAVVQGSLAYFGSYTVRDADRTIDVHIDASTYPNFDGSNQKRQFTLAGDELTLTNAAPSGGGGAAKQVWKRIR